MDEYTFVNTVRARPGTATLLCLGTKHGKQIVSPNIVAGKHKMHNNNSGLKIISKLVKR